MTKHKTAIKIKMRIEFKKILKKLFISKNFISTFCVQILKQKWKSKKNQNLQKIIVRQEVIKQDWKINY